MDSETFSSVVRRLIFILYLHTFIIHSVMHVLSSLVL